MKAVEKKGVVFFWDNESESYRLRFNYTYDEAGEMEDFCNGAGEIVSFVELDGGDEIGILKSLYSLEREHASFGGRIPFEDLLMKIFEAGVAEGKEEKVVK